MDGWWLSLSSVEHVYWIISIAASTVLATQLILACFSGFDLVHDIGGHHGIDGHHDGVSDYHFQLISIRGVVAFFALFGWSGLAFYHQGYHLPLVIVFSFICGFVMMVALALIFWGLANLQSAGNVDVTQARGLQATVYLRIPPSGGVGQISLTLQGKIIEMEASTSGIEEITTGSSVVIKQIINNIAVVERV